MRVLTDIRRLAVAPRFAAVSNDSRRRRPKVVFSQEDLRVLIGAATRFALEFRCSS